LTAPGGGKKGRMDCLEGSEPFLKIGPIESKKDKIPSTVERGEWWLEGGEEEGAQKRGQNSQDFQEIFMIANRKTVSLRTGGKSNLSREWGKGREKFLSEQGGYYGTGSPRWEPQHPKKGNLKVKGIKKKRGAVQSFLA